MALKSDVLPMLELLEQGRCRPVRVKCLEDNTQCLQAAETSYSATLGHLDDSVGVVRVTFFRKRSARAVVPGSVLPQEKHVTKN